MRSSQKLAKSLFYKLFSKEMLIISRQYSFDSDLLYYLRAYLIFLFVAARVYVTNCSG